MNYFDLFGYSIGLIIIVIEILINYLIFWFVIKLIINSIRRTSSRNYFKSNVVVHSNKDGFKPKNIYKDVSKDKLSMFNTDDINSLKDYFYDIFLNFEVAYNNLDYNMMKLLSTKQLFNNYYTGISLDLKVGKKKIINDIERKDVIIYELDSTTIKQTLSALIEISYITYTIDKNGFVTSGNRDNKVTEKFEVTFRKDFERTETTKCPNCGATVAGNKCDFCRSTLKTVEFKISSIKRVILK